MIKRLRPKYSEAELKTIYSVPHNHTQWRDHIQRVNSTIALAAWYTPVNSVADLSAGNAAIINAVQANQKYIGDYAPGYQYTGPIEQTIKEIPDVDLFILSETLEHLDDPKSVLKEIRKKTNHLILTTPLGELTDSNPQHYWGWDDEGIRSILKDTGFEPDLYQQLEFMDEQFIYTYQMWGCS